MATKNSINSNIPIEITKGGTADASFTTYAVICGGTTGTGPLQSIASVGTSSQILTSNGAAALPTFQVAPTTAIIFQVVATDPASPTNGQVWYNSTGNVFKGFQGGAVKTFVTM